ncbi:MAG: sulfite exporter TauE/SafE family protein [Patescibacteria group bacterium]
MSNKLDLAVSGLHCKACELLSEDRLEKIKNVTSVKVNHKTGRAEVYYDKEKPSLPEIKNSLEELGYKLEGKDEAAKSGPRTETILLLLIGIIGVYWLISRSDLFDFSSFLGAQQFSYPLALIVGLVAGVSTCLALVGGLVLGVAANYSQEHPDASRFQKFRPHLIFNAGRIGGFFILGGVLGLIGSTFKLSPFFNGILMTLVGLVILFLGLKLLNIFPALNDIDITLPKKLGKKMKSDSGLILGALTFFLPCGFTQAMQIYALGTGSFWGGGLVMAMFALGTAPGLLSIGGLASLLKKKHTDIFFKLTGGVIILFALFNLNNGLKLIQISSGASAEISDTENSAPAKKSSPATSAPATSTGVEIKDGVQIVTMTETGHGYIPNNFTISAGLPVRWVVNAEAPYSCASALVVPSLKLQKQLQPGENIIEFTPTSAGTIAFSCSMGMYTGTFNVK